MENIKVIGKKCYGCRACEQACRINAIKFNYNNEGFLYPTILETCISCGICLNVCPAKEAVFLNNSEKKYFGFVNSNFNELISSSSGGFAFVASKYVIENNGYVCGCIMDDNNTVIHKLSSDIRDIRKMQSSKYVQSDLKDNYIRIKELLDKNKLILFIGTPCQVRGLNLFLRKDYNNLITIDLICHGVPSPQLFNYYLKWLEKKEKSKITHYNFSYKKENLWSGDIFYSYYCERKLKYKKSLLILDPYGEDFLLGKNYRECCYSCPFTDVYKRPGDITIGDFWGVDSFKKSELFQNGISSVILHNKKAIDFFNEITNNNIVFECDKNAVLDKQHNLQKPSSRSRERDFYYNNFNSSFFFKRKKDPHIKTRIKLMIRNFFGK